MNGRIDVLTRSGSRKAVKGRLSGPGQKVTISWWITTVAAGRDMVIPTITGVVPGR
jgi:hypothetical protein